MKLAIYSPYLNHHQVAMADELHRVLGDEFVFVATKKRDASQLKGGDDYSHRSYCICAAESEKEHQAALKYIQDADVALISSGELEYAIARSETNKLTFDVSERWLKRGWVNLFSPTIFKSFLAYWRYFHHKPFYKLCCSAFAAGDHYRLGSYRNRCYKWGYFTKVDRNLNLTSTEEPPFSSDFTSLMWCARFLSLKHPELGVKLARRLKDNGYKFVLDMYGNGVELDSIQRLAHNLEVCDVVKFCGALSNEQILVQMKKHDILLFTSDFNEGWGAVANEAMSNGCVLVGSDAIGSVPFLVRDGINGCIFNNMNEESLFQKVKFLLDNPDKRKKMAQLAYNDMIGLWGPSAAAQNLMTLIADLQAGKETSIKEGPGSKAEPLYKTSI